jgi:hypothetical protein
MSEVTATVVPPTPAPRGRWRRIQAPTLMAAGALAASVLLHLRDPHRDGSWGYCPWLLLTGTYCPGCGGLRAVNDLTRGDVSAAASSNLLFVASAPLLALWWARTMVAAWRGTLRPVRSRHVVAGCLAFGGLAVTFWVLRNTGAGAWLAP